MTPQQRQAAVNLVLTSASLENHVVGYSEGIF
jgi:hypothetical protein